MNGLRPIIHVRINGQDTRMLLDTGAFWTTLSAAGAQRLGVKAISSELPAGLRVVGVTGEVNAQLASVTFELGGSRIDRTQMLIAGGDVGGEADGVLGQNMLAAWDVEYDLANGFLRLFKTSGCGKANLAYWAGNAPTMMLRLAPREGITRGIQSTVQVNALPMRAVFDTGAATTVITADAARKIGIRPESPGVQTVGMSGGIGKRLVQAYTIPIESFQADGLKILRTRIRMAPLESSQFDLLIGADFFLSTRVFVSYSTDRMLFTYNGGRLFNIGAEAPPRVVSDEAALKGGAAAIASAPVPMPNEATPTTADGYARRGAAMLARGDRRRALDDLERATELAPQNGRYWYDLARVRLVLRQPLKALAALDKAVALDGRTPGALILRATILTEADRQTEAKADLEAANAMLPVAAAERLPLADAYIQLDRFADAVQQLDQFIATHREDGALSSAHNARCWARALGNLELDRALADCQRALKLTLGRPADVLDSRAMVRLRRGDWAGALADYDAALAGRPGMAWSLLGRSVAKARLGQDGTADLAAAEKLSPETVKRARRLGVLDGTRLETTAGL
jgi:tetratricopeptide (TPR) repeat protein